jgi:hypothetical protein
MSPGINHKLLKHLREVINEKEKFPFGVLAYFGPDDKQVTKVTAIIVPARDSAPIYKSFQTPALERDPQVVMEIGQFFLLHQVTDVVMADGIIGCPHEEGTDFPKGESCPFCPFWSQISK